MGAQSVQLAADLYRAGLELLAAPGEQGHMW